MTRDEMIEHVGCGDVDAMGQCVTCDAIRAALRSRPAPPDDLALRHAWEAGFRLCRSYGDNHHHFDGEQKERRWRDYIKGLAAPAPVAAPAPETPAPDAMPEIQVGDIVETDSGGEHEPDSRGCAVWQNNPTVVGIRRRIWRRQEAQP